jgi:PKD repeat protein
MKLLIPLLLLLLSTQKLTAQTPDPTTPGPYLVTKAYYDYGDLAYKPDSFPNSVEVRGSVHYPAGLPGGTYPVVVLLHGRHVTCYRLTPLGTTLTWPCATGYQPIPSYEGYDYAAQQLASHGYIVISISANAINAADNTLTNRGMPARGQLLQHHLDLWNTFNTTGAAPFGTQFVGKLDMNNIGTMGHSRGGEGVIYHALLNKSKGSPYGIKAVLTLAPVDFNRKVMNGIPLMNIAPYCDGDVANLAGVHFYDDARYNDTTDETEKYSVLMMGANHNFFNTVWTPGSFPAGSTDDWGASDPHCNKSTAGNKRFDSTKQKAAYITYAGAFFRYYLGHETAFAPILKVDDTVPPTSTLLTSADIYVSYHPSRSERLDINRTDTALAATRNTLKDTVVTNGFVSSGVCGAGFSMVSCNVSPSANKEPHKGTTTTKGLGQMGMRWDDSLDWYENRIPPANQDFSFYESLMFRGAVNFSQSTAGQALDFSVLLEDSAGSVSSLPVSSQRNVFFFPPGSLSSSTVPKLLMNTIKIPLSAFAGVDLTQIRKVRFAFNKSVAGSIYISDLALQSGVCGRHQASFSHSLLPPYLISFTNSSQTNTGDTISWSWDFGDTNTTTDTSTMKDPQYQYSGPGSYNVCLYLKTIRPKGIVCFDTLCQTITLLEDKINDPHTNKISVRPNPAKDYLLVEGASKTDIIKLVNPIGNVVFSAPVTESKLYLPQTLATGIYHAIIITKNGNVYKKILIVR